MVYWNVQYKDGIYGKQITLDWRVAEGISYG